MNSRPRQDAPRSTLHQPLRAWIEINLAALTHNIDFLRARYGAAEIMAVCKADAYGHSIDLIAPHAYQLGLRHFGLATTEEGMYLRRLLPADASLYLLSPVAPTDAPQIVADRLIAVVSSLEMAEALSEAALGQGRTAEIHLDVDTGMGRSGVATVDAPEILAILAGLPGVHLTGLCTHFASADEDPDDAQAQHALFRDFLESLGSRAEGLTIHASNSPASLVLGAAGAYSLVRPGLLLYGVEPASGMFETANVDVEPVLSLRAGVTLCRTLPAGATISYGKTYRVPEGGGRYATIALGYGDGWQRATSAGGYVLLHGRRAPICGRVCMDQFVVDVTDIPETAAGDIATVIGRDGDQAITVGAIASAISTTPHVITTCLTARLPRIATNA